MAPASTTAGMTIGELAGATGLTAAVIRSWESRYGFPVPRRLGSGHRRYSPSDADRIRRINERRDAGVRLEVAIAETEPPSAPTTESIHAELRRSHPHLLPQELSKGTLIGLSRAIEDEVCASAARPLLIGCFQRWDRFAPSAARWNDLARTAEFTLLFADGAPVDSRLPVAPAAETAPIRREWAVIVDAADSAACLSAWEKPGQDDVPDRQRRFETLFSLEPVVVRDAVRVALHLAVQSGLAIPDSVMARSVAPETGGPSSSHAATALFARALGYLDRLH